jgi:hypothetical protein
VTIWRNQVVCQIKKWALWHNGRISLSCNLSLAPGFSPVGAGDAAPSRFNGFVAAGAENG